MNTTATLARLACLAVLVTPHAPAAADLHCERVEDPVAAEATLDLATVPFGLDRGCTVEGAAREVCSPAIADSVDAGGRDAAEAGTQERICYRVRCPERTLPSPTVKDRFGARTVTVKGPATVCLPVAR